MKWDIETSFFSLSSALFYKSILWHYTAHSEFIYECGLFPLCADEFIIATASLCLQLSLISMQTKRNTSCLFCNLQRACTTILSEIITEVFPLETGDLLTGETDRRIQTAYGNFLGNFCPNRFAWLTDILNFLAKQFVLEGITYIRSH